MEDYILSFALCSVPLLLIFTMLKRLRGFKIRKSASKLPPGPRKLPLIGNMHQLVGSLPHHRLRDIAKNYGSVMLLQLGEVSNIIISSPEAAKEVMKTHGATFAQRPSLLAAGILFYNFKDVAYSPYGEYWRQLRKICTTELLSAKKVQSLRSIREAEISELMSTISSAEGSAINFSKLLFSLTYSIAARVTFGKRSEDIDAFIPLIHEINQAFIGFSLFNFFPSIKLLHMISGVWYKLEKLSREADGIIENIIDDHKAQIGTNKPDGEEDNFVDVLLKLQNWGDPGFPLATESVKAVVLDMFLAGTDASSTTVEWIMSEMLKTPRVMRKAQSEVRKLFESEGNIDETRLNELKYLQAVIKETLRLHPPVPLLLPRECRERCEINGYEIPTKAKVLVNAWAIGRDPNYWTDPETFYPERFMDSSIDYKGNNFELIPFGAGRRMCPGIVFAMANIELPLAKLLFHFDWKLPDGLNHETLDMTETSGTTVRRKNDLRLIPIQCNPLNKAM